MWSNRTLGRAVWVGVGGVQCKGTLEGGSEGGRYSADRKGSAKLHRCRTWIAAWAFRQFPGGGPTAPEVSRRHARRKRPSRAEVSVGCEIPSVTALVVYLPPSRREVTRFHSVLREVSVVYKQLIFTLISVELSLCGVVCRMKRSGGFRVRQS